MASSWPIKYTAGIESCKRKKNDESKVTKETNKKIKTEQYEKGKRPARTFDPQWLDKRTWLQYDQEANIMKCSLCVEKYGSVIDADPSKSAKYPFVSGSTNFKASTLTDHEKSSVHLGAEQMKRARDKPTETPAAKGLLALHENMRKQLEYKFRNIHAIVKHNRPIKDFEWMNELDNAKGINTGQNYNSRFAAVTFLGSIAQSVRNETADIVKDAQFFSLTMDGTTDNAAIEQETLFLRTAIDGKVITKFLCVGEPEATTSVALHELIKKKLSGTLISRHMTKIVGFGSDGASNMTGTRGGVITLMRRDYPWLIGVHCLAHRLELSFRDVASKNKTYE